MVALDRHAPRIVRSKSRICSSDSPAAGAGTADTGAARATELGAGFDANWGAGIGSALGPGRIGVITAGGAAGFGSDSIGFAAVQPGSEASTDLAVSFG